MLVVVIGRLGSYMFIVRLVIGSLMLGLLVRGPVMVIFVVVLFHRNLVGGGERFGCFKA
jgi:hypothetical protein